MVRLFQIEPPVFHTVQEVGETVPSERRTQDLLVTEDYHVVDALSAVL